jgi:hypothetical protein
LSPDATGSRAAAARTAALAAAGLSALLAACSGSAAPPAAPAGPPFVPLFDGRSLDGFAITDFGGQGRVHVEQGRLILEPGSPLTGVHWTRPPPAGRYELEFRAARLRGDDFFAGVTFPVGGEHLTLVLGGWGGAVCGLSSLDGQDASRNETRWLMHFERGRPYRVAIRSMPERVEIQVDDAVRCAVDLRGRRLSLRAEMEPCRPLGIASFATRAAVWDLRWRPLD